MMSRRVILYSLSRPMLIVADPAGVRYQNQVGGVSCAQEELEGILCPLCVRREDEDALAGLPYVGVRPGISGEIAVAIDAILAANPATQFLHVDRARLDDSTEAWIYVVIDAPESPGESVGPLHGFGNATGVLTWPNSD